jgi:hypothetical protein
MCSDSSRETRPGTAPSAVRPSTSLGYSGFSCSGAPRRYSVIYAPDEIRVLRSNAKHVSKTVFFVNPSGGAK